MLGIFTPVFGEITDPSHLPNWHLDLAKQLDHSYALSSRGVPGITDCLTAASCPVSVRSWFCTDHSDVGASTSRRRRRYEGGGLGKTLWRWSREEW